MGFKILGTGDAMLLCPLPSDYSISDIVEYMDRADCRITNLEMVPANKKSFASTFCGGQWVYTDPKNIDELQKFGFDIYACANNHSMDFSYGGVLSTCELLEEKGIPYAGIGRSLKEAQAPVIYETEDTQRHKKRVAVISVTTTFIDAARAGNANEYFAGRPGVNALRRNEVYYVTPTQMKTLKEIGKETFINGERDLARHIGSLPPEKEGSYNFGGIFFEECDTTGKNTTCDKRDMERIRAEILKAKEIADYVVVAAHSHQIKRDSYSEPDYFFEEFCHDCIDMGACCILGGGTHQLKPIEIYKGKPIFYSLGNFIFQSHLVNKLPDEFWDKYSYPRDMSLEDCMKVKTKNGTIGLEKKKSNYRSVLPIVEYTSGGADRIELLPLELHFGTDLLGLPRIASDIESKEIYEYLREISSGYGTALEMSHIDIGGKCVSIIEVKI